MLYLLFLLSTGGAAAQGVPPLPALALDSYPPAARETLAAAYKRAVDRPDDARAVGALARALHAWEQWESAHQAYSRAQALEPGAFEWHYLDAVVLQRLALHADAARRLRDALARKPQHLAARMRLAEALLDSGETTESRRRFEELSGEPAAEPAARLGLGRIAAAEGRTEEAIKHLERAVSLVPEFGAAHYALARAYRAAGRADDARRALALHARYGPRWPRIDDPILASVTEIRSDPRATLQRGISLATAGEVDAAIAAHEAALDADPSLVQAHANLLSLYGRAGNYGRAEAHYRAALEAGVGTADLHYDYGVVMGLQQKWDLAEEAYRRAIDINPLHANARNNLGQLLERRRDFAGAAEQYRHAADAQPSFRLARFNLGRILLGLGRADAAIAEFEKIQSPRDAETPRYLFALATAYVRTGRVEEGVRVARDAQRLAVEYGQSELADAIARDLAALK